MMDDGRYDDMIPWVIDEIRRVYDGWVGGMVQRGQNCRC